ncbi:MAG: glycosyltransferase [Betaproteobacteria bacterium]
MKRVLMVAFHFPPLTGGSGIQRTLRFVQHMPLLGWQPIVLSAAPRAYEATGEELMAEIPPQTVVSRPFALDTAKHLSLHGKYLGCMARPDRWISWKFAAVPEGLRLIDQFRPDMIWSTYPIATAHLIAATLQKRSGLPWVADFRDPMAQADYPAEQATWRSFKAVEEKVFGQARACVFTTPGAAAEYRQRYSKTAAAIEVIENGYDEESFAPVVSDQTPLVPGAITLLHSGVVYPSERDPTALFAALAKLRDQGVLVPGQFRLRFRASGHDRVLQAMLERHGVADLVELCPPLPYRPALAEMLRADALVLLQASNCNAQIPAKLYEYLRAGRPILGLTDPVGDTADALRQAGIAMLAPLDDAVAIATALRQFVHSLREGGAGLPDPHYVARCSRRQRSASLAALFERLLSAP